MSKIIAITNQKGGVGKTTTAINLAASMVGQRQRVLLIDMDPQGNATMGSGADKHALRYSCNDVLMQACSVEAASLSTTFGYDLLPGNSDLTVAEVGLVAVQDKQQVLRNALGAVQAKYDFIFIDCPPALNMLTLNALVASDSVLIPMQCEYFALEGLADLMSTIEQVNASVNPRLTLEGVLRTMYDARSRLCTEVSKQLLQYFHDKVYRTVIPRNVRLAEAPSHGMPVMYYDKTSAGSAGYMVLASEILNRQMVLAD